MSQSLQFAILDAATGILGGPMNGAWRCRFRNFAVDELPADNLLPEATEADYQDTDDVERKFRFHVRHLAAAVDDAGAPVDGADRAADARYVRAQQLLMADRTLGGRVRIVRELGQKWEMEASTLEIVALVVTYEVEYSTKINDPSLPGF